VTVNRSVDVIRSWRGERQSDQLDAMQTAGAARLDESSDYEVLRADVAAALDKLSDVQRAVLIAKVYDELTFAQIADEQDVALSTVKTHYLRAIRSVRDRLRRWDDKRSND